MPTTSLIDPSTELTLGGRRAEVLAGLRAAGRPLSVIDVARLTGLHSNTARFHLDGLVGDGLAQRSVEERDVPGRPRVLYAAQDQVPGARSYGLLAEMLTGLVASLPDAGPAAVEAGRAWGRHLVDRSAPSQKVDATDAIARLNRVLDAVGFQPESRPGRTKKDTEIRLHHCPFREVAERHGDVVCALHLGLMHGALDELGAPLEATSLQPFVTSDLCVATLRTQPRPGAARPRRGART
jgi:predicted ArsR family transcriptional regulator